MPAVMPAEVEMRPSLMKIGSGSTWIAGYWSRRASQRDQWVVARLPSRGRLGEEERAGADGGDALRVRRVAPYPCDEVLVPSAGSLAARHDQQVGRVRLALVAQVSVRGDGQAARGADLDTAEARGAHPVGAPALVVGGGGEDLERAGDVEGLHAVEQDDEYCSHASQSGEPRSWQQ